MPGGSDKDSCSGDRILRKINGMQVSKHTKDRLHMMIKGIRTAGQITHIVDFKMAYKHYLGKVLTRSVDRDGE